MLNFNNVIISEGFNIFESFFRITLVVVVFLFVLTFFSRMTQHGGIEANFSFLLFIPLFVITLSLLRVLTPTIYKANIEVAGYSSEIKKGVSEISPKQFELIDNKLYYNVSTLSRNTHFDDKDKEQYEKSFRKSFDKAFSKFIEKKQKPNKKQKINKKKLIILGKIALAVLIGLLNNCIYKVVSSKCIYDQDTIDIKHISYLLAGIAFILTIIIKLIA